MTSIQELITELQRKLGVNVETGQLTLNMAGGVFQNAEARICGLKPEKLDRRAADTRHLTP